MPSTEPGQRSPEPTSSNPNLELRSPESPSRNAKSPLRSPDSPSSNANLGPCSPDSPSSNVNPGLRSPDSSSSNANPGLRSPDSQSSNANPEPRGPKSTSRSPNSPSRSPESGLRKPESVLRRHLLRNTKQVESLVSPYGAGPSAHMSRTFSLLITTLIRKVFPVQHARMIKISDMEMASVVKINEEQALWFRARRQFLGGPGAPDAPAVVRNICGIQAQQEGPALLGLSQRMENRPDAETLSKALTQPDRTLVRTWGQRDTLHIYDADDWHHMVALRSEWAQTRRQGPIPNDEQINSCLKWLENQPDPITRKEIAPLISKDFIAELGPYAEKARMTPERLAASRTLWRMAHMGHLCIAGNIGSERLYGSRRHWFPQLPWPKQEPLASAVEMARRYVAAYGPATATDLAHFFGVRVTEAKTWLAELEQDLIAVDCEGRKGMVILERDVDELQQQPPTGTDWPVRLLPLWDGLLMGHKDKSLIIPEAPEQKRVWRKGSYVAATILARGRIVATWTQKKKRHSLEITVEPLSGWKKQYLKQVQKETETIAAHMNLKEATVIL